jgi:hypothetical protein
MIDPDTASFLEDGVGIHIGTRNDRLEPNGARAIAAKVEPDGRHFVVYLAGVAAERLLPDLEHNGQAAVVFSRPTDERSCQVKGLFVEARREISSHELEHARLQWEAFLRALEHIGIPREPLRRWLVTPEVAVRLKATAIFDQTPGPNAGKAAA